MFVGMLSNTTNMSLSKAASKIHHVMKKNIKSKDVILKKLYIKEACLTGSQVTDKWENILVLFSFVFCNKRRCTKVLYFYTRNLKYLLSDLMYFSL